MPAISHTTAHCTRRIFARTAGLLSFLVASLGHMRTCSSLSVQYMTVPIDLKVDSAFAVTGHDSLEPRNEIFSTLRARARLFAAAAPGEGAVTLSGNRRFRAPVNLYTSARDCNPHMQYMSAHATLRADEISHRA